MRIVESNIEGLFIIEPDIYNDDRGYFMESFSERNFIASTGLDTHFVQDNESLSHKGVLRGLHFQCAPYSQAKLVRVVQGRVLDVAVDIRKGSPTFGKYVITELSGENHRQMFIPKGFAHGYITLEDNTLFQYKCDEYYHPEAEMGIIWNDPEIGIDWGADESSIILSNKDKQHKTLNEIDDSCLL